MAEVTAPAATNHPRECGAQARRDTAALVATALEGRAVFFEDRSTTVARAVLKRSDDHRMEATGAARRYPADPSMPAVGEELAGAGALFALAHDHIDEAAMAIDTGTPEVE